MQKGKAGRRKNKRGDGGEVQRGEVGSWKEERRKKGTGEKRYWKRLDGSKKGVSGEKERS